MDEPRPEIRLRTLWYLLEDDAGCLFLLAPALLDGCRVTVGPADALRVLAVGEELSEAGVAEVLHLLGCADGGDGRGLAVIATRRLRAWAVLR